MTTHHALSLGTRRCVHLLAMLLALLSPMLFSAQSVTAAPSADAESILQLAHITDKQRARLDAGEVVIVQPGEDTVFDVNEYNLYTALLIKIKAPLHTVLEAVQRPQLAGGGGDDLAVVPIPTGGPFPELRLNQSEVAEILGTLDGKGTVNLSVEESERLKALGISAPLDQGALDRFSATYSGLLQQRFQHYLENGIDGISPYLFEGKPYRPGEHIKTVNSYWNAWLPKLLPGYTNEISLKPNDIKKAFSEQDFLLIRKTTDDRPVIALVHRFGETLNDFVMAVHREYFVSSSYALLQIVLMGVPYQDGVLLVLGTDAFTDQVAGFGSSLKHRVGRKNLTGRMAETLREMKAELELTAR